jgi:hypothetical protein
MAFGLPESDFLGIDLAAMPIAKGQRTKDRLGLDNIKLRQLDLMDVDSGLGRFDYIVAHGVYSWVPSDTQDKLLAICEANLAPQGVAFISYNVYPGGYLRQMVRDMMLFHVQNYTDPDQKIKQAVALIRFLSDSQPVTEERAAYTAFLKKEMEQIAEHDAGHIYHDELASINQQLYFHQFARHAACHSLQFLAEADFFEMQDHIYPPAVVEALRGLATQSVILKEQYLDFLKCRSFRQTLLCHDDLAIERTPRAQILSDFYFASEARPTSEKLDLSSRNLEEFRGARGARMATDYPLGKAAMLHLGEIFPQPLHFGELVNAAQSRLRKETGRPDSVSREEISVLEEILLATYAAGLIELRIQLPRCALHAGERPVASPVARLEVENGNIVSTLRHVSVTVKDPLSRRLLSLLDGTRDREALQAEMSDFWRSNIGGKVTEGAPAAPEELSLELDRNLAKMARMGLLVG